MTGTDCANSTAARLYAQAAPLAGFGAWECDLATQTLSWTDGVYDLFGIRRDTKVQRAFAVELYDPASRRRMERARAACIAGGGPFALDCAIRTAAGEPRWMRLAGRVAYEHGRAARLFGSKQDITHEKTLWRRLEQEMMRDPLTGLSNRRGLDQFLHRLNRGLNEGVELALALIDLDTLQAINGRWGRPAGDACLREVAERLGRALPGAPLLARIDGDAFALVIASQLGRRALRRTLEGLQRGLPPQLDWRDEALPLSASIGVAFAGRGPETEPATLFARADAALHIAKAQVGGALQIFGEALDPLAAIAAAGPLREVG